jgi:adhesin/invasin
MRHTYAKITFRILLVSFLALMLIGCGEKGSPGGSSGPGVTASIDLSADLATMPADGLTSTTITASLADSSGNPVSDQTSVVFHTNLGTFRNGSSEYKVKTSGATGSVIVQLISGTTTGTAEVWAESNKVKQKIEVRLYDPDKVGTITLSRGSASITADGTSQVSIKATVTDSKGNREEGAKVNFTTTLGQFAAANPLPGLSQQTSAITDVDGEATVMLISSTTIGTATILGSLNGMNATTSVIFTAGEPKTITMRAAPSLIKPNGTSTVYAVISDMNGNPVAGQSVVFSQQVNVSDGSLSPLSVTTDVNGEAQSTYTAGKDPGQNIIQAALASDLGLKATTAIVVDPGAIVVSSITVTAGSSSLVADGVSQVKIRATVTDIDGNEAIGKTVNFTTTAGFLNPASDTTSGIGIAESMLRSSTIAGPAKVRAECDGFIAEVTVTFVPGAADHILLYAFPNVVPPNGQFQTAAIIMDKYNNRLDDQRLTFLVRIAGNPTVVNSLEMTPDQATNGVYNYTWTATYEIYGLNDIEITARVSNGVSQSVTVDIDEKAVIVGSISVTAGATAIEADGKSEVAIRAKVLDDSGQPAKGITVNFSTTLGTLSSVSEKTDQNGYAQIMLKAGTVWGTATVKAEANGFWGQTQVLFTTGKVSGLHVTIMPTVVKPGESATVIAELRDSKGEPVAGELLYFNIYENHTLGSLSAIQATTDTNGRATVTYTAGVYLYDLCAGDNICSIEDCISVTLASDSSIRETVCIRVAIPTGSVGYLTLTSADNSLPADGASSTAVTATAYDTAGIPMPQGTTITFDTTMGKFSGGIDPDGGGPITSRIILTTIDDTGKIITSLIAPNPPGGVAKITAYCAGVSQLLYIIINDGTVSVGSITLSANPTSLPADNISSSAITAVVKDTANNPVPFGTPVVFTIESGPAGARFSNGMTSITVNTPNASGTVTTSLIAGTTDGVVTLSATAGSMTQSIEVSILETITGGLALTANPTSIVANGTSTSLIRATLTDTGGNPIPGVSVAFSTSLGTLSAPSATTNASGIADVTLTSGTTTGTATVTASANGITTTVNVTFTSGAPGTLTLTAAPTTVNPGGGACTSSSCYSLSTLIATLVDGNGNPISGATIAFVIDPNNSGATLSAPSAVTNINGQATITYTAGIEEGTDTVTATSVANPSANDSVDIEVSASAVVIGSIVLTANPTSIPADGTTSSAITATLRDTNNAPMPIGTDVVFTTTLGTFPGGTDPDAGGPITSQVTLTIANTSGTILTSLVSATTPGSATVTATYDGVSQSIVIAMTGGGLVVTQIEVIIENTTLNADGVSTTNVYAYAKTALNQAVPNVSITFETSHGTITTPQITDSGGKATAVLTSSRENIDPVTVTARYNLVSGSATMKFIGVTLTLAANPASQVLGFNSTITATLLDAANKPIAGATVIFTTSNPGAVTVPTSAITNASGVATVVLQNSTITGDVTVTGTSRGATGSVVVNFGDYQLAFEPSVPPIIQVGGGVPGTSTITVRLRQYGAVGCPGGVVGAIVNFSTTLGTITPSFTTIACTPAAGYIYADATATLVSGAQGGTATIDAYVIIGGVQYAATTSVSIVSPTASKIILEADPGVISVNTGVSTIRARVLDTSDNPVANKIIYFRILQGPGGSEYLAPSLATTDADGRCVSYFYAGSIPSDNIGDIIIEASDDQSFALPFALGSCNLTIAGLVHHVSVGVNLQSLPAPALTQGHLQVGVSGIAVDINGNPVADGTPIFFSVKSIAFDEDRADDLTIDCWSAPGQLAINLIPCPGGGTLGVNWFTDDINQDGCMYNQPVLCPMAGSEDANNNGILDAGEDFNGNGVLDPPQGNLIVSPKTTINGIATTNLVYPMQYAANIRVRLTAEAGGKSNFYDYFLLCTAQMVTQGTCGLGY